MICHPWTSGMLAHPGEGVQSGFLIEDGYLGSQSGVVWDVGGGGTGGGTGGGMGGDGGCGLSVSGGGGTGGGGGGGMGGDGDGGGGSAGHLQFDLDPSAEWPLGSHSKPFGLHLDPASCLLSHVHCLHTPFSFL